MTSSIISSRILSYY